MNPDPDTAPQADGGDVEEVREFRLEGLGLVLVGAVLLAALSGAFYLGRWYESTRGGGGGAAGELATLPGADAETRTKTVSAEEGLTSFDTVGDGVETEPSREAREGTTASEPKAGSEVPTTGDAGSAPAENASAAAPAGPWTVQVAAVRDRRAAEVLYGELRDGGFDARIDAVRDGTDTVFKVRVGGFAVRDAATPTADKLKAAGHAAWVTRSD